MSITAIIILILGIIFLILDTVRESSRNKWYRRGYVEAAQKYDTSDYRSSPHETEANEKYDKDYGFKYD